MDSGYYAACTGLRTQTQALDLIANNLANLGSAGYRAQQTQFQSILAASHSGLLDPLNRAVNNFNVPDGLVISLREIGFFDSGSAHIRATSKSALDRIAGLLSSRPYRLRIEGHTDNVPIHNAIYFSNWELSTARATEIVRLLIEQYGFAPERLSAAGYAAYHPVSDNQNGEGRAQNRRVDVVILGHTTTHG
jgi:chemotaxis protein MotB